SIAVAEAALARGLMVPAVLRIVEYKGEATTWVVPQIEVVGVSFNDLEAAAAGSQLSRPTDTQLPAGRGFTPVPARQLAAPPPLADQFHEFEQETATKEAQRGQRANAQAPIPPTGVPISTGPSAAPSSPPAAEVGEPDEQPPSSQSGSPPPNPSTDEAERAHRRLMAELTNLGLNDEITRHALCSWASNNRASSSRLITRAEVEAVISAARKISAGTHVLDEVTSRDPLTDKPITRLVLRALASDGETVQPGALALTPAAVEGMAPREVADALLARGLEASGTVAAMKARLKAHVEEEPF
ncbi:MAG TPA: hypothetical protein VMH39_08380, partial [Gemmatimonadaceae bacterium]|nr:hypothetical protein [Gemmatimonadaceae bacterium]